MKKVIVDLFRMFCRYAAIVIGGTCFFIIIARIVGYLAYSDRPGPGWYGFFPKLTLQGLLELLSFVFGWGLFTLIYTPFAVLPLLVVVRMLEWAGLPRYINAVIGGLIGGVLSLWFMLAMGWYIALAGPAMVVGGMLGVFYGAWIVPVRPPDTKSPIRFSLWRFTMKICACLGIVYLLFPGLPRSIIFGRKDSYAIQGVLTKSDVALPGMTIRYFNDPSDCKGESLETVTDAKGKFNFLREYTSGQFPYHGPCVYKVTLCYLADNEWHKFWSGGHSGPCGRRSQGPL